MTKKEVPQQLNCERCGARTVSTVGSNIDGRWYCYDCTQGMRSMTEQRPSNELCRSLRKNCGHDSHSVDGCLNCEAADQIEEHEQSFNLRWKADMRAIKRWQEAHPGNDLTWPDHADLCVWLLEQLDARASNEPRACRCPKPKLYLESTVCEHCGYPPTPPPGAKGDDNTNTAADRPSAITAGEAAASDGACTKTNRSEPESVMFALLKCWWHGHAIVASIDFHPTCAKFIYTCSRCKRVLPGPRT